MANGKWLSTKNKSFKGFFLFVLFSILLSIGIHRILYFNNKPAKALPISQIKSGDLIFRQGNGLWSPYFAGLNSRSGYSHLGVLFRDGEEVFVLHADADDLTVEGGAQITALSVFITDSLKVKIMSNRMPEEAKTRFLHHLETMVKDNIPFDGNFDLEDQGTRVYCTEFIWLAAQRAGIFDFGERINIAGREVILVDSFFHSSWLKH